MIFRRKCVCAVMFTISILIVTGCGESYDDGYDDGLLDILPHPKGWGFLPVQGVELLYQRS